MSTNGICLDWTRLLGFDQADPARLSPDDIASVDGKVTASLRAKVGEKGPPGIIGRPQELGLAKS